MSVRRVTVLMSVLLALSLAACGGDEEAATAVPTQAPPVSPVVVTMTLPPGRTLPPTWTPEASLTPPPDRPTLEVTVDRATATSFTLPTLTPTATGTAAPEGEAGAAVENASGQIELVLTETAINEALATAMAPAVGAYFAAAPQATLGSGRVSLQVPLLTTMGDTGSQLNITVEMDLTVSGGRVQVNLWRIYVQSTGADYVTDLGGDVVAELQDQIDQFLLASVGADVQFSVLSAVVQPGQIVFEIERADAAPAP